MCFHVLLSVFAVAIGLNQRVVPAAEELGVALGAERWLDGTCPVVGSGEESGGYALRGLRTVLPRMGFGTAGLGAATRAAVSFALEMGYRHFDSAQATEWYREEDVASACLAFDRSALFITSKVHPRHHGFASTHLRIDASLRTFQTAYLDAMLLHYPECWPQLCGAHHQAMGTWRDSWRALEEAHLRGKVGAIGVSNFRLDQLQELQAMARVPPHIVQGWMDPFHQDREIRSFAKHVGAVYVAYSSLSQNEPSIMSQSTLVEIAKNHGASVAQVVLAFALSQGVAIIPRSRNRTHIRENFDASALILTPQEIAQIVQLDQQSTTSTR